MRILFAGTPEFAAGHLRYLLDLACHEIIAVFTQPDRPAGRGKKITASPVKILAQSRQLPVYQPPSLLDSNILEQITSMAPDIIIVVAYGLILPEKILSLPRFGCLNVHASLLPRWRGAAPVQRAIEAGDEQTGITIMQMDAGLDTGDILLKMACPVEAFDTSISLLGKLMLMGGPALEKVLAQIEQGNLHPEKQNNQESSYAKKITKMEALLDWQLPADVLERKIRAFIPSPVAYFQLDNKLLRVWQSVVLNKISVAPPGTIVHCADEGIDISTGKNVLRLKKIQLPGKTPLETSDILRGHANIFTVGKKL